MSRPLKVELNYLRVFLCSMIVITHILTQYATTNELDDVQLQTLYWIRMLLIIGTPCFILLSQLLLTLNYKEVLPVRYITNRILYILIPYFTIGLLYSYSESVSRNVSFLSQVIENVVMVNWYGYFVIVIIQFALLNAIIYRINPKILRSKFIVILSVLIQAIYLYFYNTGDGFRNLMETHYIISPNTFILGWIGYYFVGSYIGYYYEQILAFLKDHTLFVIILAVLSYIVCIAIGTNDYGEVTSFHYNIIPFVICGFLWLLMYSSNFKTFMLRTATQVGAFSFFIYLFHPIILEAIYSYTERFDDKTLIFIPLTLVIVIGTCIGTGSILREFSIFKYIIGKQPYKV